MIRPRSNACLFQRFAHDARGAVSVVAALMTVLGLSLSVLVLDAGNLYLTKRRLQAGVDAAALSAAGDPTQAATLAGNSLAANGFSRTATVESGIYTADPSLAESARFATAATGANAVRVTKTITTPSFIAGILGGTAGNASGVKATATAARLPGVSYAAGTSLASVDPNQINQVLGQLFQVGTLHIVSYDGLANANVNALPFLSQLASQVGVSAGATYGDLANANVTVGKLLAAASAAVNIQSGGTNTATLDLLNQLSLQLPASASMTVGQLINLALWQKRQIGTILQQDGSQTKINLLDLVTAAARLYGAGHLVTVTNGITIPLAGTISITTNVVVGSPMTSVAMAPVGTVISTQQVRVAIVVKTALLGVGADAPVQITLPIYLKLASGTGTVKDIPCTPNGTRAIITGATQTGLAQLGTVTNTDLLNLGADPAIGAAPVAQVKILGLQLTITAAANLPILPGGPQDLPFNQTMITNGTPQTVAANQHVLSGLASYLTFPAQSGTLLGTVLNLLNNTVLPLVKPILVNILSALDPVVDAILQTLGLRLGAIDIVVRGISCGTPTLVH